MRREFFDRLVVFGHVAGIRQLSTHRRVVQQVGGNHVQPHQPHAGAGAGLGLDRVFLAGRQPRRTAAARQPGPGDGQKSKTLRGIRSARVEPQRADGPWGSRR